MDDVEPVIFTTAESALALDVVEFAARTAPRLVGDPAALSRLHLAAQAHGEAMATAVAAAIGDEYELLDNYAATHPWLYEPARYVENGERVVSVKLLYVELPPDTHAEAFKAYNADSVHAAVVAVCRDLLALQPSAEITAVTAVGPDGRPAGYGDFRAADKRIPRRSLPPEGAIAWNRLRKASMAELSGRRALPHVLLPKGHPRTLRGSHESRYSN
ncbi:hypothetical protein ABH920_009517 [Catenulispora sp. EB89]|uniref:hypothetical protein n=1 Tax=Catenulispora sp. EB89 TaxID=3156257 RepID=UPI003518BA2A